MKEHPIPQDITGYRFHIVGSMTLKQFGEVLLGVILAFLVYKTNLFFLIKWPLVIFFFGAGLISAFIPIEERPMSHWLTTFFGIIYKPTQFFWKRTYNIPAPFLYVGDKQNMIQVQEVDLTPARRQRIKEFLNSTSATDPLPEDLTSQEQRQIMSVLDLFDVTPQTSIGINPTQFQKPDLKVRVRSLRLDTPDYNETVTTVVAEPIAPEPEITPMLPPAEQVVSPPVQQLPNPEVSITIDQDDTQKNVFLEAQQVAQNIEIPQERSVSVQSPFADSKEDTTFQPKPVALGERSYIASQDAPKQAAAVTNKATFNASLPFPDKPTVPNKLVGMVLTSNQELIPEAIVEISSEEGHVVRAVKTNALGQFFITTPLKQGKYVVNVQKQNFTFEPMSIELKNSIVEPLEIRSL
jgi:hypothetical protein